jgi:hypothetical protein
MATTQRLFDLLEKPFVSRRFENYRHMARFMLGELLGPKAVAEVLAPVEPNVVWADIVLEPRARAYKELRHPLAAKAQRDWQQFLRNERMKKAEAAK